MSARLRKMIMTGCLFALACGRGAAPPEVAPAASPVLTVTRGSLEDRVLLTGELEAVQSDKLVVPKSPAWVLTVRWLATDGSQVKKGDRVVEFDSSSLSGGLEDKRSAILRTENELAAEVARVAGAVSEKSMEVVRKRALLEKATADAEVPADLRSRREYQEKQLVLLQARDALAKAEEELASTRKTGQLDQSIKEVARARAERDLAELQKNMEDLTLRAPRDGMVQLAIDREENRKYLVGDQVRPMWIIATLPDLSTMQVRARLYDVDDGTVAEGMTADSILDSYPDKVWSGKVAKLAPVARPESRDALRRYFEVLIALDGKPEETARPGMSVRVEVVRRRAKDALLVPRAALRAFSGKTQVQRESGGLVDVEIDWCSELQCVARSGLVEGTRLAPLPSRKGGS